MDNPSRRGLSRPVPLWQNRDYLLLWCGRTVSVLGTQVSLIAFPLLVLSLTGSPAIAGLVASARTVPYLLFSLPAGALVDRWDRKVAMIVCSAGSAITLASIPVAALLGAITIPHIAAVSFIEGSFGVVYGLAETSALPHVVPKAQLSAAVAQQQLQFSVGAILGPSLGGALYTASPLLPFALDASSYALSSLSLTAIRTRFSSLRAAAGRSLWDEVGEGVRWLWRQPLIRYMALLTGLTNFAWSGVTLIVVVLAEQQGASPATIGILFAVAGAMGVLGAILAPGVQRRLSFGQAIIGLCWCFAAVFFLFSFAVAPVLLLVVLAFRSLIYPSYDTVQMTYRLALIPDALQGRVNSVFRLGAQGFTPLGLATTGLLLERVGGTATALVMGLFLMAVAAVTSFNRHVRLAPRLSDHQAA